MGGDALTVRYRVENLIAHPCFLFTYLFHQRPSGEHIIDPKLALTAIDQLGNLAIEKITPAIPSDMDVEYPVIPYAELVPSRSTTDGIVSLSLPLRLHSAYDHSELRLPSTSKTAMMRIGYLVASSELYLDLHFEHEGHVLYEGDAGFAFSCQQFVTSDVVALAAPIW